MDQVPTIHESLTDHESIAHPSIHPSTCVRVCVRVLQASSFCNRRMASANRMLKVGLLGVLAMWLLTLPLTDGGNLYAEGEDESE